MQLANRIHRQIHSCFQGAVICKTVLCLPLFPEKEASKRKGKWNEFSVTRSVTRYVPITLLFSHSHTCSPLTLLYLFFGIVLLWSLRGKRTSWQVLYKVLCSAVLKGLATRPLHIWSQTERSMKETAVLVLMSTAMQLQWTTGFSSEHWHECSLDSRLNIANPCLVRLLWSLVAKTCFPRLAIQLQ